MIKDGSWKDKTFRRYDVKINVPKVSRGKRHCVNQATDYAKQVWVEMGFKEMEGPMVNTCFWNFDALFVPQDHPAREMQDTFYLKTPKSGKLPDTGVVEKVKAMHESGGDIESSGWQYIYDGYAEVYKPYSCHRRQALPGTPCLRGIFLGNLPSRHRHKLYRPTCRPRNFYLFLRV